MTGREMSPFITGVRLLIDCVVDCDIISTTSQGRERWCRSVTVSDRDSAIAGVIWCREHLSPVPGVTWRCEIHRGQFRFQFKDLTDSVLFQLSL